MCENPLGRLSSCFAEINDPRVAARCDHKLIDILCVALCAVLSGADQWTDVESYGKAKLTWLRTFLDLPNGIPSHDTFGRVFARIDPEEFREGFMTWVRSLYLQMITGEYRQINLDGKTLRRSHDRGAGQDPLHVVSAWSTDCRLVLGEIAVKDKSNEITAIPCLLKLLDLEGAIITIDAIGCQRKIASQIIQSGGDYILQVKGNQQTLFERLEKLFIGTEEGGYAHTVYDKSIKYNKDHGRMETRQCFVVTDEDWLLYLQRDPNKPCWAGLRSVVKMVRQHDRDAEPETSYYISSLAIGAEQMLDYIRGHWGIENSLHWVLDMAYREDESRTRVGHAQENLSILRHLTLNLLKQDTSLKLGIHAKRLRCGWHHAYVVKILGL
jgi:predicted transposase YbfD/YdcC